MPILETENTKESSKKTQLKSEDMSSGVQNHELSSHSKKTKSLSNQQKSMSQIEKERVLSILNAEDKNIKDNPELFDKSSESSESFAQLLETEYKNNFSQGDVVKGVIIDIQKDFVLVDINYKSEGLIPIHEFRSDTGDQADIEVGHRIEVYIERLENENGMVVLSKIKADMLQAWNEISKAAENQETIEGVVIAKVKGGLSVDIGVKAFLPGSQIDVRPVKSLDEFVGKTLQLKVIKFNKKRGNIVLPDVPY